jgi:hypothetical protein
MLDLNRADDDVDWDMLGMAAQSAPPPNGRARSGLGLVPRRLPGLGIWRPPVIGGGGRTIEGIRALSHRIGEPLSQERERWGAVLLIDLHSMPPLPRSMGRTPPPSWWAIVSGPVAMVPWWRSAHFAACAVLAAHNRPYAGICAGPSWCARRGFHAMQLEIDRATYLDPNLVELGDGFDAMVRLLTSLIFRWARKWRRWGTHIAHVRRRRVRRYRR